MSNCWRKRLSVFSIHTHRLRALIILTVVILTKISGHEHCMVYCPSQVTAYPTQKQ